MMGLIRLRTASRYVQIVMQKCRHSTHDIRSAERHITRRSLSADATIGMHPFRGDQKS